MVITDLLERNARLYGAETALVEINPSEERDRAKTWREFSLIENSTKKPTALRIFCSVGASKRGRRSASC